MGCNTAGRVVPFSPLRRRNIDFLRLMHRKHIVHALMEFDVTRPRRLMAEHRTAAGESLSFTAFVIGCLAKAIDEDRRMHAYRKGRGHLILFDEVDVATLVGHEVDGAEITVGYIIRAANRKTLRELHRELRESQQQKAPWPPRAPWHLRLFFSLPACLRVFLLGTIGGSPYLRKKMEGTVVVTAGGMFSTGMGWGIPMSRHPLCIAVGGFDQRPRIVDGRIEACEHLCLTISADHDVIDGVPLARFSARFRELVEGGHGLEDLGAVSTQRR